MDEKTNASYDHTGVTQVCHETAQWEESTSGTGTVTLCREESQEGGRLQDGSLLGSAVDTIPRELNLLGEMIDHVLPTVGVYSTR